MTKICARRLRQLGLAILWSFAIRHSIFLFAEDIAPEQCAATFKNDIAPLLKNYCYSCHGGGKKKGGVTLDHFPTPAAAITDHKLWEAVLENLRTGEMPPDDKPQPTLAEREKLMGWIDSAVFAIDPKNPDPGRVTTRRLNRTEYNNTVRDLTGIEFQPAADFPADDSGYGFDNIGDVLTVPPVLFEHYLDAAEKIVATAIATDRSPRPQTRPVKLTFPDPMMKISADERPATTRLRFPVAGSYKLRMACFTQKLGDEDVKMEVRLGGKVVFLQEVIGSHDQVANYSIPLLIAAPGAEELSVRITNPLDKPVIKQGRALKRRVLVKSATLITPVLPFEIPESHRRLLAPAQGATDATALRAVVAQFARRAFRRPLREGEVERFAKIGDDSRAVPGATFEHSAQAALAAVLVSPSFLFRTEAQPQPDDPRATHPIDEWSLASRLSYFLWSTMPDDALFAEAHAGALRKNFDAQVRRMLADPKARALVDNFAAQWRQFRNITLTAIDPKTFPMFTPELAAAMEREVAMYFEHLIREDRPVLELLDSDYTFVNPALAEHYGIAGVKGPQFRRVTLPDARRGGVLTQAGILLITSNPTRTSPVKRGKYVLGTLLGTPPPPPPPPEVPALAEGTTKKPLTGTLRQRLEQHRADPTCAACHARMDPLGFGLENFDAIGRWRDTDGGDAINPSGRLVSGQEFQGPAELRKILLGDKRADFVRCLSEKMLTYALGRGLEHYDKLAVRQITTDLEKGGHRFSALVSAIARSVPFQMRRGEGERIAQGAK